MVTHDPDRGRLRGHGRLPGRRSNRRHDGPSLGRPRRRAHDAPGGLSTMLRIAFSTLAARKSGSLGAFAAVALAVLLIVSCGVLLQSSLRVGIPVERLASGEHRRRRRPEHQADDRRGQCSRPPWRATKAGREPGRTNSRRRRCRTCRRRPLGLCPACRPSRSSRHDRRRRDLGRARLVERRTHPVHDHDGARAGTADGDRHQRVAGRSRLASARRSRPDLDRRLTAGVHGRRHCRSASASSRAQQRQPSSSRTTSRLGSAAPTIASTCSAC